MGRLSKHKAVKAAVTKRRKKSGSTSTTTVSTSNSGNSSSGSSSGARRTPASLAESIALANGGGASPTGSTGTAGSSTPSSSSSSSAKECEQCGNPTMLDGVSASRTWTTSKKQLAANGCQICDFVTYRKSQRPCVHCERAACEHFCEWCGNGYHTKCARVRDEKVHAPNGFCCRKCEVEQADDDELNSAKAAEAEEIGARCGSCRLPFNATGRDDANSDDEETKAPEPIEEAGFKVNQSVLVENEEVLYNAVITDVDLKGERIKIHFIRWSKSFDNWYAMDDERINESLACDCCNHWFHIGCLPPIKSSGRFKDTTYVCPTCIDDAKHFHNNTRTKAKTAVSSAIAVSTSSLSAAHSRSRKSSVSEDAPAAPAKRKSAKPIVTSDDELDVAAAKKASSKKKRKLSVSSDSPVKTKPELSRSKSRSKSPESVASASPSSRADATASNAAIDGDTNAVAAADAPRSPGRPSDAVASPRAAATDESDAAVVTTTVGDTNDDAAPTTTCETPSATTNSSSRSETTDPIVVNPTAQSRADANTASDPAMRRKASSHHSVSSLLNSPPSNDKPATPPLHHRHHPHMAPLSMLDENRRSLASSFDVLVKSERSHHLLPPLPTTTSTAATNARGASSKAATAKPEPYQSVSSSTHWSARASVSVASTKSMTSSTSSRSALSAFDILRQVATQSIGGELDAVAPPPTVKPKKERQRASAAKAKAMKAEKAAAAAAAAAVATDKTSNAKASGNNDERVVDTKERVHLNAFVDLHFSIRKEMYLKFCGLEEQGLLDRDTAQLLRSLIYPTSERFQDLKFVYLVNKDLSPLYLTKRLLEVVPQSLGGTGVAAPPSKTQSVAVGGSSSSNAASTPRSTANNSSIGSVASSPASTNHTTQSVPTIVPPGLTIPSFSEIIASEKAAALLQQQQQRQHLQLQQHLQQQHQTLQAAALATSTALELRKKTAMRPDAIVKELAPLPSASAVTSAVSAAASAVSAALSSSVAMSMAPSVPSSTLTAPLTTATTAVSSPSVQSDILVSRS